MDSGYSFLFSDNIYVECFRETMPLLISGILLYLYYKKQIHAIDALLYAFATEAYTMIVIGPTFTATFFISIVFLIDQVHQLLSGKLYIKRAYLLLLILPLLSSIAVFLIVQFYKDPFYYPGGKLYVFYTRPLYFYLKTYLPLFAIGAKIVQEKDQFNFDDFLTTIKTIAKFSCIIAALQIFAEFSFNNLALDEILGLQRRYLQEQSNDVFSLRIQALFSEPKIFSAFLSLSIPVFLKDRNFRMAGIAFLAGILTVSQTFWINLVAGSLVFLIFPRMQSVRLKIIGSLLSIVCLFLAVAGSKEYFIKEYAANQQNTFYQLIFKRSAYRYDTDLWGKNNILLGMPLQRELELPVVDFLKDEPYLLLSGYGGGNSTFIPPQYFFGQLNYENRLAGIGGNNLNMRWFFILAEFGGFALLGFFLILTQSKYNIPPFQNNYFAFIWICFFFSQIDLLLVIVALLSAYDAENQPSDYISI
ncbi:hypothetical protein CLV51_102163 [Chitinophaga niastensis]|uniref:O-antigen ligase-like membrane protein n=1 Tax=Chitinophaga niastensis TaxID=536980 RepID=A0A2P8HM89_CHINA|nr:hypothetical protein [Chitinophaga niastensis]PSL47317.1 hypothetical protein CLV51_102163 [Chitinophaga niastensis]